MADTETLMQLDDVSWIEICVNQSVHCHFKLKQRYILVWHSDHFSRLIFYFIKIQKRTIYFSLNTKMQMGIRLRV